jgi:hypothetical protein
MHSIFWIVHASIDFWQTFQVLEQNTQLIVALAALSAFVISVINLWYSALQGPIITLAQRPDFIAHEIRNNTTDIPHSSEINLDLVFVNSGSRTGVFKLAVDFKQPPAIAEYINSYTIKFESDDNDPIEIKRQTPLLFVQERASKIVKITLTIDFSDWKSHFEHHAVDEKEICPVLIEADDKNKRRLSDFCQQLKVGRSLGTFSVDLMQTKSRLIRRLRDKTVNKTLFHRNPLESIIRPSGSSNLI